MRKFIVNHLRDLFFLAVIVFCACTMNSFSWAAEEGLDELIARIARQSSASWGYQYLEDPENYIWQPETLHYTDILTGREVWRLSSTPGYYSVLSDISFPSWSADGGPRHIQDHTQPYNWGGEMEPLTSYHSISDPPTLFNRPYCADGPTTDGAPDCSGYWSHVAFDRWGKKAGFSASEGPYPYGVGTIDIDTHEWHVATFNDGAQHHDWHAWSD